MNNSLIPVTFLAVCLVGCLPTNETTKTDSKIEKDKVQENTPVVARPEVYHLKISKDGVEIQGKNLKKITKVSLHDGINKINFDTGKKDKNIVFARALSTLKLAFNKTYELIL